MKPAAGRLTLVIKSELPAAGFFLAYGGDRISKRQLYRTYAARGKGDTIEAKGLKN